MKKTEKSKTSKTVEQRKPMNSQVIREISPKMDVVHCGCT